MNPWYERTGGYAISVALHLFLVSLLLGMSVAQVNRQQPPPIELTFVSLGPEPEAQGAPAESAAAATGQEQQEDASPAEPSPPAKETSVELETAAATGNGAEEDSSPAEPTQEPEEKAKQEEAQTPPKTEPTPQPPETPEAKPVQTPQETPEPDPKALAELAEKQRQQKQQELIEKEWQEFRKQAPSPDESRLRTALQSEELRLKGKDLLDPSIGKDTGAVRQFDFRGPQRTIDEIQRRYDMRTVTRWVGESESGAGYLNRADTNRGIYHPSQSPGMYEVFEIGPAGSRKMKELEIDALRQRGFDPKKDRLVEIVFGIVITDKGPDLGVLKVVAEKMNP